MSPRPVWLFVIGLLLAPGAVSAAESPQEVVSKASEAYLRAFEKQDTEALAGLFTPEAEYIDADGTIFHGRGAIEAEFAAQFAAASPGKQTVEVISIRPIAEGVLVEDGVSTFVLDDGTSSRTRYAATHVRQKDGSWLMASVRELDSPVVSPHDRLMALAWLVGKWSESVDGVVISTEWKWTDDGNFLVSEFSAVADGGPSWKGSHRVGWDAERKQFRSWIFDSTGGSMEGWWAPDEDGRWSVAMTGVDADGERESVLLSYAPDGEDAIVIAADQRVRGGIRLPGRSGRVVRPAPEPAASVE